MKAQTADDLYADREHLASARKAAEIWAADLAKDANNFEAAWKLARVCYWLGGHAPQDERRSFLERGIDGGATGRCLGAEPAGRPFLAGRGHGQPRGIVRPAARV